MPPKKTAAPLTFRTPEWPERACRVLIPGEYANHSCEVVESHQGPCAAYAVPESVTRRAAWEKQNPKLLNQPSPEPWIA